MATYYVRTTGNDSTGDGSSGNPWLTVHKALSTAGLGSSAGDIVDIGAGTFAEDSGSGYLNPSYAFTNEVIIRGAGIGQTIITGTGSGTTYAIYAVTAGSNQHWQDMTWQQQAANHTVAWFRGNSTAIANITLTRIGISSGAFANTATFYGLLVGSGGSCTSFTMVDCAVDVACNGLGIIAQAFTLSGGSVKGAARGARFLNSCPAITLTDATFESTSASNIHHAIAIDSQTTAASTVHIDGCTATTANGTGRAMDIPGGGTGQLMTGYVRNCTVTGVFGGIAVGGFVDDFEVSGNTITVSGGEGASISSDSYTGPGGAGAATGSILNNTITATGTTAHGALAGVTATGVTISGNNIDASATSGGFGLVLKGGSAAAPHQIGSNTIRGGGNSAVYAKGCDGAETTGTLTITSGIAGAKAIRILNGDATPVSDNLSLTNMRVTVTNGELFEIGADTTHIGTGVTVNSNVYRVIGSGTWGSVRGTTISSLPSLRAAWSDYDITTNDAQSRTVNFRSGPGVNPSRSPFARMIPARTGNR